MSRPSPAYPPPPPPPPFTNPDWSLDDGITSLEALTGHELRPQQRDALVDLYNGHVPPSRQPITLIISPLKAIQNNQSTTLNSVSSSYRGFVLDGNTNTLTNCHAIARGDYIHIWVSAEIALGELLERNREEVLEKDQGRSTKTKPRANGKATVDGSIRRVRHVFPTGHEDYGTFTSVLQPTEFQKRLYLVAIDELHLCSERSWGGPFRPAMGQLHKIREHLLNHTRLFGTTATLKPADWDNLKDRAGFRNPICLVRADIYRHDIYMNIMPSPDPQGIIKRIIYTALSQAGNVDSTVETRTLKIIIFLAEIAHCVDLRDRIIQWLQQRLQRRLDKTIIKTYHGDLTKDSRQDIEHKFSSGEIRILCATIAYAIGVKPAGVQYILQRGLCGKDEALQKLGRAILFWIPDVWVHGERQAKSGRPLKYPVASVRTAASMAEEARRQAYLSVYGSDSSGTDASTCSSFPTQSIQPGQSTSQKKRKRCGPKLPAA
ncbi:P-loop containing nucleoside triphosphate hydrolase protein [Pyrenochaeta sp. MPI-SDFR-AT-0127]|nr:P-loop containing nucleoside triphosphate hydrolase protein [Pyrenochaeta sp. MPI-SDFR-AT-0127]